MDVVGPGPLSLAQIEWVLPTSDDGYAVLRAVRWGRRARCPYCQSLACTDLQDRRRHHCNSCRTSFSPTVSTVFHGSHADLRQWFAASSLYLGLRSTVTVRDLAIQISVNKNTAARMLRQISASDPDARRLLLRLDDYLQTMFLAMKGQQNE